MQKIEHLLKIEVNNLHEIFEVNINVNFTINIKI